MATHRSFASDVEASDRLRLPMNSIQKCVLYLEQYSDLIVP
jgi:hypothetical protein